MGISSVLTFILLLKFKQYLSEQIVFGITGLLFGLGLVVSGMVKRDIVLGFLIINENWNPALMFVLAVGVGFNLISFHLIQKRGKPFYAEKLCIPTNKTIDWKLIVGELCFGIGWGIGGICPGPMYCCIPLFFT